MTPSILGRGAPYISRRGQSSILGLCRRLSSTVEKRANHLPESVDVVVVGGGIVGANTALHLAELGTRRRPNAPDRLHPAFPARQSSRAPPRAAPRPPPLPASARARACTHIQNTRVLAM